jgi:RES domain-containing protein
LNLSSIRAISLAPPITNAERRIWYRAIQPHFLSSALATAHTKTIPSRFNGGSLAATAFRVLYLAENPMLALFEVQALLGTPMTPGGVVPNPRRPWTILNVNVNLSGVLDLTNTSIHAAGQIETSVQELTGDWRGYQLRTGLTSVSSPTGRAPTQELGAEIYNSGLFEGFLSVSAKLPDQKNLIVFPDRLKPGSSVTFTDANGQKVSL